MKKKIKDLTLEEVKTICKNNSCDECPLKDAPCQEGYYALVNSELNQEIEVEDDARRNDGCAR